MRQLGRLDQSGPGLLLGGVAGVQRRTVRGLSAALRDGQHLEGLALRPGRLVFLDHPVADHAAHGAARGVRVRVVVLLADVRVGHGAIHPHVGDGIAVAVGAAAPVLGPRLARGVLASMAGPLRAGPVLARSRCVRCACVRGVFHARVLPPFRVLDFALGADAGYLRGSRLAHGVGRGRAWCGRGAILPLAFFADAGVPLAGELVAFLGGACFARPVLRVQAGRDVAPAGSCLLVGPFAIGCPGAAVVARLAVAVAVLGRLGARMVVVVRGRVGAAGLLTWCAWSSGDLARLVNGGIGVPRRRVVSPEKIRSVEHGDA